MATIETINASDDLEPTSRGKINDNFSALNTDKAEITYVDTEVAKKVGLTGDETVAGRKNFSGTVSLDIIPEIPTTAPTLDAQVAGKKYVDDNAVFKTGDQSVAGRKAFSGTISFTIFPEIPTTAPTLDAQVASKKYVDDTAIAGGVDSDETHKGIIEVGTQAEVAAVALDNKAVTPLKLGATACMLAGEQTVADRKVFTGTVAFTIIPEGPASNPTLDNQMARKAYVATFPYIVSNNLRNSNDTQRITTETSYTKIKETVINTDLANVRIAFTIYCNGWTTWCRIYKNGVAIGTERSTNSNGTVYTEDFADLVAGDLIQIYAHSAGVGKEAGASNLRFYYDQQITVIGGHTLTTPIAVTTCDVVSMTNNS